MDKTLVAIVIFSAVLASCSSPTIGKQTTAGGTEADNLQSMCLTKDGGFIVGGWSDSDTSHEKTVANEGIIYSDMWIVKYDKNAAPQWNKCFGGSNAEYLRCITPTDDGGYIIAGESLSGISGEKTENSRGGVDIWVIKTDSAGNIQWDKTIGGSGTDICNVIRQTADGGYILGAASNSGISGDKTDSCRGDFDIWAIKLDHNGKIKWNKTIGGNEFEFCGGIELTSEGGVLFCGNSASGKSGEKTDHNRGTLADCWLVKLDANGTLVWQKSYGGKEDEMFVGIKKTPDNNFILSAFSTSGKGNEKSENSCGRSDYWILKVDATGKKLWDKTIGGAGDDTEPWSILPTMDGGYIVGGRSNSGISGDKTDSCRGEYDFWVVKLDQAGKIEWDKTIGGKGNEILKGIVEIEKNQFILGGYSDSGISGDKTDSCRGKEDYWIVYLKH